MPTIYSKKPPYYGKFNGQGMLTLSFDDGREDFYRVVYPILKKMGLIATLNIPTAWIDGTMSTPGTWLSAAGGPMTVQQIQEIHGEGFEIAGHGDWHLNTEADITTGVIKLKNWGVSRDGAVESFASPGSGLTIATLPTQKPIYQKLGLLCARSDSATGATAINNLNNINYPPTHNYRLTSQTIIKTNVLVDLIPVIRDAVVNRKWCILTLHSILRTTDAGYGADDWFWDVTKFTDFINWVSHIHQNDLLVVTTSDGYKYANGLLKKSTIFDLHGRSR